MKKILAHVRWVYATLIIFLALTLSIILFPFVGAPRAQKISAKFIQLLTGFTIEIQGEEDPKAQLFLPNHRSDLDIEILELAIKRRLTWVAKKELFDVPFFGLALKLPEDIAVDRENKKSLLKLLKDAKDRLDKGRTLVIFPEGTRSRGDKLLPFKSGAKIVADKYKLKVQPIVLIGTRECFDVKTFTYTPKTIKVIFLPSFYADTQDKEWLNNLRKTMQKVYDDELANNNSNR